jgi:hypothetical protein
MGSKRRSLPQRAIGSNRHHVCNYRDTLKLMASHMLLLALPIGAPSGSLLR